MEADFPQSHIFPPEGTNLKGREYPAFGGSPSVLVFVMQQITWRSITVVLSDESLGVHFFPQWILL
jgi:hypothetical protein